MKRALLGYLPVNIVQAVAGFGAITVLTRLLSPTDYGAYALGFSVMSLVQTSLFTWLEASIARFHAAEADGAGRAGMLATVRRAYLVLIVAVPLLTAVVLFVLPLSTPVRVAVAAGVAAIMVRSPLKMIQERRRAAGEVAGYVRLDVLFTGGAFLLGAAFAAMGLGGAGPLIGAGVAAAACLAIALPTEAPRLQGGRFEPERLRRYAAYGLPLSLSLLLSLALATTDRFVLAAFLNEGSVGAYHAGYSLSSRTLDVVFIWLGMAAGPAAVAAWERGGQTALEPVARTQAAMMLLIALPAAAGLALVARPLSELMVGGDLHTGSAQVTPWIAAGALFSGLTTYYFGTAFTLGRRTRRLLVAIAIPAVANMALALILIPRFGLNGAAWATAAGYAIGLVASVLLGRGVVRMPFPWLDGAKALAATGLMAAVVLQLPALGGMVELALKGGAGAAVYGVAVLVMNVAGAREHAAHMLSAGWSRLRPSAAA